MGFRYYPAMTWSFALFFVVMLAVLSGINLRAYRWATRAFSLSPRVRRLLAGVLWASVVGMAFGRILDRVAPGLPSRAVLLSSSVVQLTVVISFALLLLLDLGFFGAGLVRRFNARGARNPKPVLASAPEAPAAAPVLTADLAPVPRRAVLTQIAVGSAFLVGSSSSLYGTLVGRHDYTIEELPVRLPGLSKALDGFTIVQLSDIHVGSFVGDAELEAGFEFVRRAKPDLVVLTGDLIDHDPRVAERLGRFVRRLVPLAREGVTAIMGNHDFYAGVDETANALERAGAEVLRNQGRVIGGSRGFALLGVDDVWAKRFDPHAGPDLERAVRTLPAVEGRHVGRDLPRVLLCHNPSYFERSAGHVELQLSGHTHGGQVNLMVRPGELFLKNGWIAGLYERSGSGLYVNRGFGTAGPPARVGAPPEISRIVLTSA
jgi:predicted MPP superfamily phosphohydrolase